MRVELRPVAQEASETKTDALEYAFRRQSTDIWIWSSFITDEGVNRSQYDC